MRHYRPRKHPPIVGVRHEMLEVIREIPPSERPGDWRVVLVKCDCGVQKMMALSAFRTCKSCGCWQRQRMATMNAELKRQGRYVGGKVTHGMSRNGSTEYVAWRAMLNRCYREKDISYPNYGGRGIKVCERWRGSFENFIADLGMKPSGTVRYTLERRDSGKDYGPKNCYWATYKEQQNNRRSNRKITLGGVTKTLTQWCNHYGVVPQVAFHRISRGWSERDAVSVTRDCRKR